MTRLRIPRVKPYLALAGIVAVCALLLAQPAFAGRSLADYEVGNYKLGGSFRLTDQHGKNVTLEGFKGKVVVLTLGYTHCPDVCPATLSNFVQVKRRLGGQAEKFRAIFISVDPERDSPARLKSYIGQFDATFTALTGDRDEIDRVVKSYMGVYRKGGKTARSPHQVAHTSFIYLMDRTGKVRYLFPADTPRKSILEGVRKLIGEAS